MNRLEYNLKILLLLSCIASKYPDLRFTQILTMLGLDKDNYYEESHLTYLKIVEWMKRNEL